MKLIKLLLAFVILIGGIYIILNWKSVSIIGRKQVTDLPNTVDEYCEKIRNEWKTKTDWDLALYNNHVEMIEQAKGFNTLSDEELNTIDNCLREEACNKVYESIFREFNTAECIDTKVRKNYIAVDVLYQNDATLKNDERMRKIESCYSLYLRIYGFVNSNHWLSSSYHPSNNSWNSFESCKREILNTAAQYRNNSYYGDNMSKISSFRDGLNETKLTTMLDSQKNRFYHELTRDIEQCFKKLNRTKQNYNMLKIAFGELSSQDANAARELKNFMDKFEEEITLRQANSEKSDKNL